MEWVQDEIESTKEEINRILSDKGKEIIFNSRVRILEEDEKCSKFFFKKIH